MSEGTVSYRIDILAKMDKMERMIEGFDAANRKLLGLDKTANNTFKNFKGKFSESNRSLNQLNATYVRLEQAYRNAADPQRMKAYADMINRVKGKMNELEKATEKAGNEAKKTDDKLAFMKKAAGATVIAAGARKAFEIGSEISQAAQQVEKYNVTLKNMLGSTGAARDRMQEYINLAKKTPFELSEVVEGGNKLQAIGRYSAQNLTNLGDLAAASGKPLEQVLNAYSKLSTGQKGEGVNMFRDLLISVEDWTKATGKGITKNGELKASTEEMINALPKILKTKGYLGMMASQSEITSGKLANLSDGVFQLKVALGDRLNPSVNSFANYASKAIEKMQRIVEIPLEQKIAAEKSEVNYLMNALIDEFPHEERRKEIIDELNRKYPEILKNINLEKDGVKSVREELEKQNDEYDRKMRQAIYKRMIENLKGENEEDKNDMAMYQQSILASKRINEIDEESKKIIGDREGVLLTEDGFKRLNVTNGVYNYVDEMGLTKEQYTKGKMLGAEYAVLKKQANIFGGEEKKIQQLEAKYNIRQKQIDEWQKLVDGEGVVETDTTKTNANIITDIENDANSISAGGKTVKNFSITINDGMINGVTNNFASSSDNPETADNFMWQLRNALLTLVNDVNYTAG